MLGVVPRRGVSVPFTQDQIKLTFGKHDRDRDGRLSKEELEAAFKDLGSRFPPGPASRALRRADANGDGYICQAELGDLVMYASERGYHVQ